MDIYCFLFGNIKNNIIKILPSTIPNIKENQSYTISGEGNSPVGFANGNANVKLLEESGIMSRGKKQCITLLL